MPKVLQSGIFKSTELNFPQKIPEGIKARCQGCFASLITEEGDKGRATKRANKQGIYELGWRVRCLECGARVFFSFANAPDHALAHANGWKKDK